MSVDADIRRLVGLGPVVATESDGLAADLLDRREPMWNRRRFDPGHFTVSGFVVAPDRESILLVEHGRLGRWLQPGGHVEDVDDSVDHAARREVHEETGIASMDALSDRLLRIDAHAIPARGDEPPHTHVDLALAFLSRTGDIGPIDEVLDARWVRFEDLVSFDTDDAVRSGAVAVRSLLTRRTSKGRMERPPL